jgi:hypothetical protein
VVEVVLEVELQAHLREQMGVLGQRLVVAVVVVVLMIQMPQGVLAQGVLVQMVS